MLNKGKLVEFVSEVIASGKPVTSVKIKQLLFSSIPLRMAWKSQKRDSKCDNLFSNGSSDKVCWTFRALHKNRFSFLPAVWIGKAKAQFLAILPFDSRWEDKNENLSSEKNFSPLFPGLFALSQAILSN